MVQREAIAALTGLRFVAAFFVALAHLLPKAVPMPNPENWYQQVYSLASDGMTLFFVLSGFVIHYNYSDSIKQNGARGLYNFFVARFARLYPLYIVTIFASLLLAYTYQSLPAATSEVLPSYLLMVQTWFYWPVGKYGLVYEMGLLPAVAWSISTEWFFYLAYPLILFALLRLKGIAAKLWLGLALAVVISTAVALAAFNMGELNAFGVRVFGSVGEPAAQLQYTFFRWLIYFSPYSRVFEFTMGCICASVYMSLRDKKVSAQEQTIGLVVLVASIAGAALLHWWIFSPGTHYVIVAFHMSFGFAPFVTIIVFCCARYQNTITRALSSWPMVTCGEASYSLYMLHLIIAMAVRWEAAPTTTLTIGVGKHPALDGCHDGGHWVGSRLMADYRSTRPAVDPGCLDGKGQPPNKGHT